MGESPSDSNRDSLFCLLLRRQSIDFRIEELRLHCVAGSSYNATNQLKILTLNNDELLRVALEVQKNCHGVDVNCKSDFIGVSFSFLPKDAEMLASKITEAEVAKQWKCGIWIAIIFVAIILLWVGRWYLAQAAKLVERDESQAQSLQHANMRSLAILCHHLIDNFKRLPRNGDDVSRDKIYATQTWGDTEAQRFQELLFLLSMHLGMGIEDTATTISEIKWFAERIGEWKNPTYSHSQIWAAHYKAELSRGRLEPKTVTRL